MENFNHKANRIDSACKVAESAFPEREHNTRRMAVFGSEQTYKLEDYRIGLVLKSCHGFDRCDCTGCIERLRRGLEVLGQAQSKWKSLIAFVSPIRRDD